MRILFIDLSTNLQTIHDLNTKPRGGMITSLFKVTDYLSTHGHEVYVYADIKEPGVTESNVVWSNELKYLEYDVLVLNRGIGYCYSDINAKRRILWTHDLPHTGFIPDPLLLRYIDCTVFMSTYAQRVWKTLFYGIGKSVTIPNGVDKDLFYPRDKDLRYLIYFNHPNRGLKRLGLIYDSIHEVLNGDIHMNAYSGNSMYPVNGEMEDHIDEFTVNHENDKTYDLPVKNGFNVLSPLLAEKISEEVGKAGLFILPTAYPEICSNSVLQSLASGTPVITTGGIGSVPEWIRHDKNGMLTTYHPGDFVIHRIEMIRNSLSILQDPKKHKKMIKQAAKTKILSWEEVGQRWDALVS